MRRCAGCCERPAERGSGATRQADASNRLCSVYVCIHKCRLCAWRQPREMGCLARPMGCSWRGGGLGTAARYRRGDRGLSVVRVSGGTMLSPSLFGRDTRAGGRGSHGCVSFVTYSGCSALDQKLDREPGVPRAARPAAAAVSSDSGLLPLFCLPRPAGCANADRYSE